MRQSPLVQILAKVGLVGAGYAVVALIASLLLLMALHRLLARCAPIHRTMSPRSVWLNLIPVFNLFWSIQTVRRVAATLRAEYADRRLQPRGDLAEKTGYAAIGLCIGSLALIGLSPESDANAAILEMAMIFASFVAYIIYLTRINDFTHHLPPWSEFGYEDPDEDDRPPLDIPLPANTDRFIRREDHSC
jgi:hypothetical protein